MAFASDGTFYTISGPEGAPWVVLIHGLGLTGASTWGAIAPALARRFRVLSYELPGHGESALPAAQITLAALGAQLIGLLDELGIARAGLVGFSLGGMINRRCAIDHPGRVGALVVLNSPHDRGPEAQRAVEERARQTAAGGPAASLDETLARWFTEGFRQSHPEVVARIRAVVLANEPANYAAHRRVLAEGVRALIAPNPPITAPTQVMTCAHDSGSTPAMSHAIAREIAGAELQIVPGLQHLGLIEQPHLFARPIEAFLARALTE